MDLAWIFPICATGGHCPASGNGAHLNCHVKERESICYRGWQRASKEVQVPPGGIVKYHG